MNFDRVAVVVETEFGMRDGGSFIAVDLFAVEAPCDGGIRCPTNHVTINTDGFTANREMIGQFQRRRWWHVDSHRHVQST